ncbi:MAG: hypothetical protein NTY36_07935 [Deltaproteobacteria bacterium]|nr:hypothetical protein [Deltaproteobacteria bacterium]
MSLDRKFFEEIAEFLIKLRNEEDDTFPVDDLKKATSNLAIIINNRFNQPNFPLTDESIAVSLTPKTAALFYDRIWESRAFFPDAPKEISIYGATEEEIWIDALHVASKDRTDDRLARLIIKTENPILKQIFKRKPLCRKISEALYEHHKFNVIPIYESIDSLKEEYQPGNKEIIFAAIKNIGIVDEDKLEWSQVMEFRKDLNARKKYRRMIHWLDTEMVGRPANFIADRIAIKLEDYEWALKKHGIEAVTGCLSRIIDPKFIAASSVAMGSFAFGWDKFIAAIGGLGLLAGQVAISITKAALDINDRRRGKDSEIAYVYEMKKKLK